MLSRSKHIGITLRHTLRQAQGDIRFFVMLSLSKHVELVETCRACSALQSLFHFSRTRKKRFHLIYNFISPRIILFLQHEHEFVKR